MQDDTLKMAHIIGQVQQELTASNCETYLITYITYIITYITYIVTYITNVITFMS